MQQDSHTGEVAILMGGPANEGVDELAIFNEEFLLTS